MSDRNLSSARQASAKKAAGADGELAKIAEEGTTAYATTNKKLLDDEVELDPLGVGETALDHGFDEMEEEDIRPFEPVNERVCLQWHNIEISALPTPGKCGKKAIGEKRLILDNISGSALPGEFLSIIGASGAGKTTLLNHLSGRLTATNLEIYGDIMINGQNSEDIEGFSRFSAYIQQDDVLLETFTVRECIEFAARLRLHADDQSSIEKKVKGMMDDLKLNKCAETRIGGTFFKGVSGGERKRTSIAVELITKPSLIFLDEPTTGLDSYTATTLMRIFRNLAKSGCTVIQTIHQPNSETYELFDKLMLLAKGKVIYFDTKDNAVPYFKSIGFECPPLTTPSDYFMSIMSVESIEKEDIDPDDKDAQESSTAFIMNTYKELIDKFDKSYQESALKNDPSRTFEGMKPLNFEQFFQDKNMSWCNEFWMLLKRNMINIVRIPLTSFIQLFSTAVQAAVAVLIYQNIDESKSGVQDRRGVLFYIALVMGFLGVNNVVQVFPVERPVFLRESNNNLYRVSTYFWSKVVSQLPAAFIIPTMFVCIVYFSVGLTLSKWYKPLVSILGAILEYNAFVGFGYIIGTAVGDK